MNVIEPSGYVQKVKIESQQKTYVDHKEELRKRSPNFKHKDGKIYASRPGEPYWVCPVSPYHPSFRSQIEDGVWPLVYELTNKNYMTIASCEGHKYDEKLYVALVFSDETKAKKFIDECSVVPGWNFRIENSTRYMWVSERFGDKVVYTEKKEIPLKDLKNVFNEYNILFFRNYEKYIYVDMELMKYPYSTIKRLWYRYVMRKPYKDFIKNKNQMIELIRSKLSIYEG